MGAKVWYVAAGKKKAGPMTSDRLRKQLTVGKLPEGALAWRDGMEAWEPVSDIERFQPQDDELEESAEVEAPRKRKTSSSKAASGKTKTRSKARGSKSGTRKALKDTAPKARRKRSKSTANAVGEFEPLYRLSWKDMFQAFSFGLEFGRIKLALAAMMMPAGATIVLAGVAAIAAKIHALLALPVILVMGIAAYVLTMVAVGALSFHTKHQVLELERPTVKEALTHALQNAGAMSVPPFVLSLAWLAPVIVLGVLAVMVKIPYLGPIGTGALFGVHVFLGGLTLFLLFAAGVSATFGPVVAAFEGSTVKTTLGLVLSFAKRSMPRTVAWGFLPSLLMGPFAFMVELFALASLALPVLAVFAAVGPETLTWLQSGGTGDAPYPGAMTMVILIGIWVELVAVAVFAVIGSVHNALFSLLYVAGREGHDSLISRDTYLARCSEGAA